PATSRESVRLICTMRLRTRSRSSTVNMMISHSLEFRIILRRLSQPNSCRVGQEKSGKKMAGQALIHAIGFYATFFISCPQTVSWLAGMVSINLAPVHRPFSTSTLQAPFTVYMRGYDIGY